MCFFKIVTLVNCEVHVVRLWLSGAMWDTCYWGSVSDVHWRAVNTWHSWNTASSTTKDPSSWWENTPQLGGSSVILGKHVTTRRILRHIGKTRHHSEDPPSWWENTPPLGELSVMVGKHATTRRILRHIGKTRHNSEDPPSYWENTSPLGGSSVMVGKHATTLLNDDDAYPKHLFVIQTKKGV